jgi:hypothetical protein
VTVTYDLLHIAFIGRTSSPTTPLAVLAMQQAPLLLEARRGQALLGPGIVETVLVRDLERLGRQLAEGRVELLYLDRDLVKLRTAFYDPIRPYVERSFEHVADSADGRLELLRHRRR